MHGADGLMKRKVWAGTSNFIGCHSDNRSSPPSCRNRHQSLPICQLPEPEDKGSFSEQTGIIKKQSWLSGLKVKVGKIFVKSAGKEERESPCHRTEKHTALARRKEAPGCSACMLPPAECNRVEEPWDDIMTPGATPSPHLSYWQRSTKHERLVPSQSLPRLSSCFDFRTAMTFSNLLQKPWVRDRTKGKLLPGRGLLKQRGSRMDSWTRAVLLAP